MTDDGNVGIATALATAYSAAFAASLISQNITVERVWYPVKKETIAALPDFDPANFIAGSIHVFIMSEPETPAADGDARGCLMFDYPIQVGIAAKPLKTTPQYVDPLHLLSQQLRDFPLKKDPAYSLGIGEGCIESPQIIADPYYDALKTDRLYLGVWVFKFLGGRLR